MSLVAQEFGQKYQRNQNFDQKMALNEKQKVVRYRQQTKQKRGRGIVTSHIITLTIR